jgi:hypothetical protein
MAKAGTLAPGGGGKKAKGAKGAKGAKSKKAKAKKGKAKRKKKKGKNKCGDSGTYGDLKKKYAGGNERDHVPSSRALQGMAEKLSGGDALCPAQIGRLNNAASACAIPKRMHAKYSKTFRSRNRGREANGKKRYQNDASNPQRAARRDTKAIKQGMKKSGASKECQKKYAAWAKKVCERNRGWYNRMIKKALPEKF